MLLLKKYRNLDVSVYNNELRTNIGKNTGGRSSNFELLRILSMLLIIMLHYCMYGGSENIYTSSSSINSIVALLLGSWGSVGVGCFFLISGYFTWNSKRPFRIKKLFLLLTEAEFYFISIYLINCYVLHGTVFTVKSLLFSMASPVFMSYWYLTVYLILYVLTPFLAKIVQNSNQTFLFRLLIVLTVIVPVYKLIFTSAPVSYLGYGIYVWLLGAYFGKYGTEELCCKAKRVFFLLTGLTVFVLLSCYFVNRQYHLDVEWMLSRIRGIISPFQVTVSIWLFLLFKGMKIPYHGWINKLASTSLAVYLVHMNSYVRELLFSKILNVSFFETKWYFGFHCVFGCLGVYIVIAIFDLLRDYLLGRMKIEKLFSLEFFSVVERWFYLE